MKIRDIPEFYKPKKLITFASDITVKEACVRMSANNIGAVPVVDDGKLVGIFSERDLVKRVVAEGKDPAITKLADVMTFNPTTVYPHDWVQTGIEYMVAGKYRHLPVVDDRSELVGFLSQRDFLMMSVGNLLKQTAHVSLGTLIKAPFVWLLIGIVVLYTILLLFML